MMMKKEGKNAWWERTIGSWSIDSFVSTWLHDETMSFECHVSHRLHNKHIVYSRSDEPHSRSQRIDKDIRRLNLSLSDELLLMRVVMVVFRVENFHRLKTKVQMDNLIKERREKKNRMKKSWSTWRISNECWHCCWKCIFIRFLTTIDIHSPITFVFDGIEEKIFFASFDGMSISDANMIDPAIFLIRKEAIFNAFKCFRTAKVTNRHH